MPNFTSFTCSSPKVTKSSSEIAFKPVLIKTGSVFSSVRQSFVISVLYSLTLAMFSLWLKLPLPQMEPYSWPVQAQMEYRAFRH